MESPEIGQTDLASIADDTMRVSLGGAAFIIRIEADTKSEIAGEPKRRPDPLWHLVSLLGWRPLSLPEAEWPARRFSQQNMVINDARRLWHEPFVGALAGHSSV